MNGSFSRKQFDNAVKQKQVMLCVQSRSRIEGVLRAVFEVIIFPAHLAENIKDRNYKYRQHILVTK